MPAKFYFFRECCILVVMNQNQPNLVPLVLILTVSLILAVPGGLGGIFLFVAAIDALNKPFKSNGDTNLLALLLPLPVIIGFLLLGGYIWTAVKRRFVKWFWLISAGFNLVIFLLSGGFLLKMTYENFNPTDTNDYPKLIFLLFPLWTLFVTIASVKYAFYKPTDKDLNFP